MTVDRKKQATRWIRVAATGCVVTLVTSISGCGEDEAELSVGAPETTTPEVEETSRRVSEVEDLVITVTGNRAELRGSITPDLPTRMRELIVEHPEVDTLVLVELGSSEINASSADVTTVETTAAEAAETIREAGLTTVLPADGHVVDAAASLFAAGVERRVELDAERRIGRLVFGPACCDDVGRRSFQQFLGPELGTALMDHLDAVDDGSSRALTPLEVDLFGLSTSSLVLAAPTSTDQGYGFDVTVDPDDRDRIGRQPEDLLAFLVDRFNDAQDPDEEGVPTARSLFVSTTDETLGHVVIEGGLDDSIGGVVIELLLESDGAAGWFVDGRSARPICRRGISDELCL